MDTPIRRLTVRQYHNMIRAGVLKDGDPVELLEGLLVLKSAKTPRHSYATQTLRDLLSPMLPPGWLVDAQEPVTTQDSEPETDVAVARGERRHYLVQGRHPGPDDTGLVVEVANSSLAMDETGKARVYGRAAIPVYWIVNLVDRRVQVYTDPTGPAEEPGYRQRHDFGPDAEVPVLLAGREVGRVAVRDLLL